MHNDEAELKVYLYETLSDYVYSHIAIDHDEYTQAAVAELLGEVLRPVPMHDKNMFSIPVEPMNALSKRLSLSSLEPYDENWTSEPEVIQCIKRAMLLSGGTLKTQSIWHEEREVDYANMPHRPRTPLLSRSALKKTPKLGASRMTKCSLSSMLPNKVLMKLEVENISRPDIKLEDTMDLKLAIEADVHSGIVEHHQSNPFLVPSTKPRTLPRSANTFLRSVSPPYERKFTAMSPPLFPRPSRGKDSDVTNSPYVKDLIAAPTPLRPVQVENLDPDVAQENMNIVDGWTVIISSERNTPPLTSGSSEIDQLDDDDIQLWRPSSSFGLPESIEALRDIKMDEPLFPRKDRARGGKYEGNRIRDGESLSAYLKSHVPMAMTNAPNIKIMGTPKSDDKFAHLSPPSNSMVALSMLGQPPSEDTMELRCNYDAGSDDPKSGLIKMMKSQGIKVNDGKASHQDIIMNERLDEKEAMFMNVPYLSAPNSYLRDENNEPKLKDLVPFNKTYSIHANGDACGKPIVPLRKVPGLKSLNLELSWRPFNFGTKVPTHQELLGVDSDAVALDCDTHGPGNFCLKDVLDSLSQLDDARIQEMKCTAERFFLEESESEKTAAPNPSKFPKEQLILLSRSERLDLARQNLSLPLSHRDESSISTLDQSSRLLTPENEDIPELADILNQSILNYESDIIDERDRKKLRADAGLIIDFSVEENEADKDTDDALPLTVDPKELYLTNPFQHQYWTTYLTVGYEPTIFSPEVSGTVAPRVNNKETFIVKEDLLKTGHIAEEENLRYESPTRSSFYKAPDNLVSTLQQHDKAPPTNNLLLCERRSLNAFLGLRGKKVPANIEHNLEEMQELPKDVQDSIQPNEDAPVIFSEEARLDLLKDTHAFTIPEQRPRPSYEHAYLCSIDFIQHRALTRALESDECQVHLVGRENLSSNPIPEDGVVQRDDVPHAQHSADISIIVSPDAAVVFFPLAALPSENPRRALFEALARHSWRFARILLVLVAFPRSELFRFEKVTRSSGNLKGKERQNNAGGARTGIPSGPCAYSPPVLKTCRRLRRELALRVGTGEQSAACTVELAFADTVEHAAQLIRAFGDAVLSDSVVDMAPYLDDEEKDGETDLAQMEGMNPYCAAVILRCCTLNDFLSMSPEQRLQGFSGLIGLERMNFVNELLQTRMQYVDYDSSLPASSDLSLK